MRYTRVKDCPICGSQALLITEELSNGRGGYPGKYDYRFTCPHCDMIKANGGDTVYQSKEDAIEKENYQQLKTIIKENLSQLERKVLKDYLQGYSYKEIATRLQISSKSIDNCLSRIKSKLKAKLSA